MEGENNQEILELGATYPFIDSTSSIPLLPTDGIINSPHPPDHPSYHSRQHGVPPRYQGGVDGHPNHSGITLVNQLHDPACHLHHLQGGAQMLGVRGKLKFDPGTQEQGCGHQAGFHEDGFDFVMVVMLAEFVRQRGVQRAQGGFRTVVRRQRYGAQVRQDGGYGDDVSTPGTGDERGKESQQELEGR